MLRVGRTSRCTGRARVLPCRHDGACSPRHVGHDEDGIETIDSGVRAHLPRTSVNTSNRSTSRVVRCLQLRSVRSGWQGKVASATPRYSSSCADYRVRRPMSVRWQYADAGGPSVGFGALRRSQKRAATCTGLASPGCAAPPGFLNLLTRCSTRNPSGLVSCR
jgi:hypothetical protein